MSINASIESAENIFKQILEDFFTSFFDEESLPSHGIDHHRRVWNYAKEIYSVFNRTHPDPAKLMIACYLHDAGMSVDNGVHHGKHGSDLCRKFLNANHLSETDYADVLYAIENHDDKNYRNIKHSNDILSVLSVADDLDAFGFTGVYRYLEIYERRGTELSRTGFHIKENAAARFEYFEKIFGMNEMLFKKHKARFHILDDFFKCYNDQVSSSSFNEKKPAGYYGAAEMIIRLSKTGINPRDFYTAARDHFDDPVVKWFFEGLEKELNS